QFLVDFSDLKSLNDGVGRARRLVPEIVGVEEVEGPLLAGGDDAAQSRQEDGTGGAEGGDAGIEKLLVEGGEEGGEVNGVAGNRQAEHAAAELIPGETAADVAAVAGLDEDAGAVGHESVAGLPDAGLLVVGRCAVDALLNERLGIEAEDPA